MLKVTTPKYGNVWIQCEKVIYVREDNDQVNDGVSSVVAFVGGDTIRCKESSRWIKDELDPHHHKDGDPDADTHH